MRYRILMIVLAALSAVFFAWQADIQQGGQRMVVAGLAGACFGLMLLCHREVVRRER